MGVIDASVRGVVGVQLLDPRDLASVFGDVRLNEEA